MSVVQHDQKTIKFIEKAKLVHGDKYNYDKTVYINSKENVIIICKNLDHPEFKQMPDTHLKGSGCTLCAKERMIKRLTSNTEDFIVKAQKVHGTKYDYSLVDYKDRITKVTIICKIHGQFEQSPRDHLNGSGCPVYPGCRNGKRVISNKPITSSESKLAKFIEKANIKHNKKYDYSKSVFVSGKENLIIICEIHGEFEQTPECHMLYGCQKCGRETAADKARSNTEEFIRKAIAKHGNKYDYSKVEYEHSSIPVKIICKTHGEFSQAPSNHLTGQECPDCYTVYSKASIEWLSHVASQENIHIRHALNGGEFQIPGTRYKADGYCQKTNTIYEYCGCWYHFCNTCNDPNDISPLTRKTMAESYKPTQLKMDTIKKLGYNLIIMWEHDWIAFCKSQKQK